MCKNHFRGVEMRNASDEQPVGPPRQRYERERWRAGDPPEGHGLAVVGVREELHTVVVEPLVAGEESQTDGGELRIGVDSITLDEHSGTNIPGARPGRFVCLSVADNGVGMDQGTMERIFEPCFTTKPPREGTRLGLSIVLDIASQHRAWLTVHSEPGRGSTFKLYLPAFQ